MSTTDAEHKLRTAILHCLERHHLDPSARWTIACSGGRDSSVLATVLCPMIAESGGSVEMCHVNHGLRSESEHAAERTHVERLAGCLGVAFHCSAIEPGAIRAIARSSGRSVEDVARELRYRALGERVTPGGYLVTGHHLHDQLETVLMRLTRGSGARGLAGIPEVRPLHAVGTPGNDAPLLVRPLLTVDPAVLEEAAQQWSASRGEALYVDDDSNQSPAFRRNRYRVGVTPALLDTEPSAAHGISVTATRMREVDEAVRFAAAEALSVRFAETGPSEVRVDAARFSAFPAALRRSCAFLSVERLLGFDAAAAVSHRFFGPLVEWDGTGDLLIRGHGVRVSFSAESSDGAIVVLRDVVRNEKKGYLVTAGAGPQCAGSVSVVVRSFDGRWRVGVRVGSCRPPLVVRSRRPGDRVAQRYGHKQLKKLCREREAEVLVLEDRNGIVAALFSPWGGEDLFRPDALRLERYERAVVGHATDMEIVWQGDTGFEFATE